MALEDDKRSLEVFQKGAAHQLLVYEHQERWTDSAEVRHHSRNT